MKIFRVCQTTGNLGLLSEKTKEIDIDQCMSVFFEELKSPRHTAGYGFAKKRDWITSIIDAARVSETTDEEDLSDLYLFRAIYSEKLNSFLYIEDIKAAHTINKQSLPAAALFSLIHHQYGHESFEFYAGDDSICNLERFPRKG